MTIKAFVFDAYGTLYDVQSVTDVTEEAFPGHGEYITQIWRMKQLEYTWLRSLMGCYKDFYQVTRESLEFALGTLGLSVDDDLFRRIVEAYNTLSPYPDTAEALASLAGYRLAILSNGSPDMLKALVRNTGLERYFESVISVDAAGIFKPDRRAYALVEDRLGIRPEEVLFVSSNGFDVCGAKSFGFKVARIERVTPTALRRELTEGGLIGPSTMFRALRMQTETLGYGPDVVVSSLRELPEALKTLVGTPPA